MTGRRIVLLGCAGCGKTTLARRLGAGIGAPVIVLDDVWRAHGGNLEAFRAAMRQAHAGEAWISDGNFALASFDIRLPRADLLVWLDRPRWICAARAIGRVFRPGEAHELKDLVRVLAFIRRFDRVNRPRIEAEIVRHGPHLTRLRLDDERQARAFLSAQAPTSG